jgi:hypothetical protein
VGSLGDAKDRTSVETAATCFESLGVLDVAAFKRFGALDAFNTLTDALKPKVPDPMFKISLDEDLPWYVTARLVFCGLFQS